VGIVYIATFICNNSPLFSTAHNSIMINNGANLQWMQSDSSSAYSAPRLAEQFYLIAGNLRLLESCYQSSPLPQGA